MVAYGNLQWCSYKTKHELTKTRSKIIADEDLLNDP